MMEKSVLFFRFNICYGIHTSHEHLTVFVGTTTYGEVPQVFKGLVIEIVRNAAILFQIVIRVRKIGIL